MSSPFFETEFSKKLKTYMWNGIDVDFSSEAEQLELPDDAEQQLPDNPLSPGEVAEPLYDLNQSGLVHYNPLDRDEEDKVGSLNWTVNGDPQRVSGVGGSKGLELDGSGDYLQSDTWFDSSITNTITISVWANFAALDSDYFVLRGPDTGSRPFIGYSTRNNELFASIGGVDGGIGQVSGVSPRIDELFHLVLTYDGREVEFYVNNVSQGTDRFGEDIAQNTPIFIGYDQDRGASSPLNLVDEFQVFNKALTAREIDTLYQKGT